MSSKFERVISEIEEYIDNCNFLPLSNTKIIVVKEDLEEMIHELSSRTPEEIRNCQKVLRDKDRIIGEAKQQAAMIIESANIQTANLINEHEIMQKAYAEGQAYIDQARDEAQKILDAAVAEANAYRQSAIEYTDSVLASIQGILESSIQTYTAHYEGLIGNLNSTLEVVVNNRSALVPADDVVQEYEESSDSENAG